MKRPTLLRHLLAWVLGALFVVWVGFVLIGLHTGEHEADELTDGHLASTASLLLSQRGIEFVGTRDAAPPTEDLKRHDYQQSMSVVVWDGEGRLLSRIGEAPAPAFDVREGFETIHVGASSQAWRTFARWDSPHKRRRVMVLLSIEERDDLAWDIAGQVAEPALWLLPVVAIALGLAIRRGLRPLGRLSDEVAALNIQSGEPLHAEPRHEEFRAVVTSINTLIGRYLAAVSRERQLAGELAHEMRTPLASLTLHAQTLNGPLTEAERRRAQAQVAQDALRAGQVMQHLLSLARANHTELAEHAVPLNVVPVAARVLADHSQSALDGHHELALTGDETLAIEGHEILIEIALRNLLENALGHAPSETVVEVEVNASARWIQVVNVASPSGMGDATGVSRLGLGLGHRVVEKIADLHQATFEEVPLRPNRRCYRLTFHKALQA